MAFAYCAPANGNVLLQGEILQGIFEIRPDLSRGESLPLDPAELAFRRYDYPHCIVVTNDCDLFQEHEALNNPDSRYEVKRLLHIIICPLWTVDQRTNAGISNSSHFRKARSNNDLRYHCFPEAPVPNSEYLPELLADFKAVVGLPVDYVYALLSHPDVKRLAQVPTPYMQHFMQRFYFWQSRIALPEE